MSEILKFLAVEERIRAKAAYAECVVRRDHSGVRFELCVRDDLRDEPFIVLSRREGDLRWRIEWHDGDAELEIGYDDLAGFLRDVSENGIDAALDRWGRNNEIEDLRTRLAAAEAEAGRLRKLFDDAGEGVCDVLGLIDHYQALSREDLRARWDAEALAAEFQRLSMGTIEARWADEAVISGLRARLADIARDASGALPTSSGGQGVGPSASYHAMARALDRIAAVASIGTSEGTR